MNNPEGDYFRKMSDAELIKCKHKLVQHSDPHIQAVLELHRRKKEKDNARDTTQRTIKTMTLWILIITIALFLIAIASFLFAYLQCF